MKEAEETIAITMKMVKEEEEEEIEEVEDVEEETMEVKKGVKDKKAMKAEDNIEVEEEAEDIVTIEEETEGIVIIKKEIKEKREFIKINKLVNYLRTRNKLKSNNSKINKVLFLFNSGQYSKKEAEIKGMQLGNFRNKPKV